MTTPPDAGRVEEIRERHELFEKDIAGRNLRGGGSNWLTDGGLTAHADRAILLAALTPTPPPTEPEGEWRARAAMVYDEWIKSGQHYDGFIDVVAAALARARGK